jgi:hypothetical protein
MRLRPSSAVTPSSTPVTPAYIAYVDVAGWYETTPDETAMRTCYDLARENLAASLPLTLGEWQGVELGTTDEIETWYESPELVLRRRYTNAKGDLIWLTAIGSRGPSSFHIFEHTPHICYQSTGWRTLADEIRRVPLQQGAMPVRRGLFAVDGTQQVVYYWYQWDGPSRDPAEGVASWRLTGQVNGTDSIHIEEQMASFLNLIYLETYPWHRF